jgi:hypothetical protein
VGLLQRGDQQFEMLLEHREQQVVLGLEVVIQHRLRGAARLGDVLHLRVRVAGAREQRSGRVHDRAGLVLVVVGANPRHPLLLPECAFPRWRDITRAAHRG